MSGNQKQADKSRTLTIQDCPGKSRETQVAELATNGVVSSAGTLVNYAKDYFGEVSLAECAESLARKAVAVHSGDMKEAETMLVAQAAALDGIFAALASRARMNMGEYMNAAEKYMRLALKAQGQCRATLETLADIKNPRPYIQNNRAQFQQVNNGESEPQNRQFSDTYAQARAGAGKNSKMTNGLLEEKNGEWLDTGAQGAAGGIDKELAAVATQYGAED